MKYEKLFLTLTALFCLSTLFSQDQATQNTNNTRLLFQGGKATTNLSIGSSIHFINPRRAVEGTVYLFDSWDNYAVIHATNNEKFLLRNINLNISRNSFESKIGNDSIFGFSFNNIEKFVINNRVFKNYYWDNDNRVYEVIAEGGDVEILRGFSIRFVEGSPNPMLNRYKDKYVKDEKYFARKNDKITTIRLKKSYLMKLLDMDDQRKEKVLDYIEDHKLSFKNERDLRAIFDFAHKAK